MKYTVNLNLMEMVGLASACSQAIDREHSNFVRILNNNGEAIRALEMAREKILLALKEENHGVELDLMELVQLYSAAICLGTMNVQKGKNSTQSAVLFNMVKLSKN